MFYIVFLHGDCPVGSIVANGCRNLESSRQLGIYYNFTCFVKVMGKIAFTFTITEYIVGNMFLRFVGSVKIHLAFDGENVAIVFTLGYVVVNRLYNHRCLKLFFYKLAFVSLPFIILFAAYLII